MSAWRRKAIGLFPWMRNEMQRPDYSIYSLFFDLLPMAQSAHKVGDEETLKRVYGYAEWCFQQWHTDLLNAAGVAFYEHLFDDRSIWKDVVVWLSPDVFPQIVPLWKFRLSATQFEQVMKLWQKRQVSHWRETILFTGELDKL
jgi:hypothetical protein